MTLQESFNDWVNSDNVLKCKKGIYKTQCTQYAKSFDYMALRKYFISEYWNA